MTPEQLEMLERMRRRLAEYALPGFQDGGMADPSSIERQMTEDLLAEYDDYEFPGEMNYDYLRNALELGADINDLRGFMDPRFADVFYGVVDAANRRSLIDRSEPMAFTEEDIPGRGYPPSDLIERMYNELIRRATGFREGGIISLLN